MIRLVLALLLLGTSAPALAGELEDRIEGALAVEYVLANCDPAKVTGPAAGIARFILDGAPPETVARLRAELRRMIAAGSSSPADACAKLEPLIPDP